MNPRTVCFCQPILSMISASVAPFFRWSMATTWAVLLPSRWPAASCVLAASLALGAFLAGVVFLVALALAGAPLAACAPSLALARAFGFAASPRLWMPSQIRPAAALAPLKLFTGFTPVKLFQIATSLSGGQAAASSASSFWLAKESNGVVVVAAASSWVANALMLFSASMVNVFMWVPSFSRLTVTITFITPVADTSKRILLTFGRAMGRRWCSGGRLRQVAPNERPRCQVRAEAGRSDRRTAHATKH